MIQNEVLARLRVNEALRAGLEAQRNHRLLTEGADPAQPTKSRVVLTRLAGSLRQLLARTAPQRQRRQAQRPAAEGSERATSINEPAA